MIQKSLIAAILFLSPLRLLGDIKSPLTAPPQPLPAKLQVLVGEKGEIILRAHSSSGLPLKFLIRRQPSNGTLTEIESVDNYTAKVIYQHNASRGAGTDSFTYAVQASNTGVSAPERVIIRVVEPNSNFQAPSFLSFDGVTIGESTQKTIVLKNTGGGMIKGTLELPAPWKISEGGHYRLGAEQSKEFVVTFSPTEVREYREIATYSHDPLCRFSLSGEGLAPIRLGANLLMLKIQTGGRQNSVLEVENLTKKSQELQFETPQPLATIPSTILQPKEIKQIPIQTSGVVLHAIDASLGVKCGIFTASVRIKGFALPAKLSIEPSKINFGTITPGHIYRKSLTISNSGGTSVTGSFVPPQEITVSPDPVKTPIDPGKTVAFEIVFEPHSALVSPLVLTFSDGNKKQDIPLDFTLDMSGQTLHIPIVSEMAHPSKESKQNDAILSAALRHPDNWKPLIDRVGLVEKGKNHLHLVWRKLSNAGISTYSLETLVPKKLPDGSTDWAWIHPDNMRITSEGEFVHAMLTGLPAGGTFNYRIVTTNQSGEITPLSETFRLTTRIDKPIHPPLLLFLFIALIIVGIFVWKQRRNQALTLAAETERILKPK